jgi:hypothetical protein
MCVALYFYALNDDTMKKDELFYLMLDMNSWEIGERVIADKKNADKMIAEFMDGMDEFHFKDVFKEHYRACKEYGKKHYQAETEMAPFRIPKNITDDPLAFQYAGVRYFIADQYCTNPKCQCNEVTLGFFRLTRQKTQTPEFIIKLHLDSLDYETKHVNCDSADIPDIVKYFLDKQGALNTLRYRYQEMKGDGGASHMKRIKGMEDKPHDHKGLAEPKIGRNDPCPCGSGKKYKKCCGL